MKVCKQLSVFLENRPGTLAQVTGALAAHGINILGFSILDAVDYGVLRIVVNKPVKAAHILGDGGMMVVESDVITLSLPNKPGSLARLAAKLSKARVNIEYAYASAGRAKGKTPVILKVDNVQRAHRLLRGIR